VAGVEWWAIEQSGKEAGIIWENVGLFFMKRKWKSTE
jgi:hypothetical protein